MPARRYHRKADDDAARHTDRATAGAPLLCSARFSLVHVHSVWANASDTHVHKQRISLSKRTTASERECITFWNNASSSSSPESLSLTSNLAFLSAGLGVVAESNIASKRKLRSGSSRSTSLNASSRSRAPMLALMTGSIVAHNPSPPSMLKR